ncbi:Uncharacterised protein [uncultured archaeon]|nr:Uncharacterised protein [uncultured archaeon]
MCEVASMRYNGDEWVRKDDYDRAIVDADHVEKILNDYETRKEIERILYNLYDVSRNYSVFAASDIMGMIRAEISKKSILQTTEEERKQWKEEAEYAAENYTPFAFGPKKVARLLHDVEILLKQDNVQQ